MEYLHNKYFCMLIINRSIKYRVGIAKRKMALIEFYDHTKIFMLLPTTSTTVLRLCET